MNARVVGIINWKSVEYLFCIFLMDQSKSLLSKTMVAGISSVL